MLVLQQRLQHGQVVAEGLAAGGRGDDDGVLAGADALDGLRLVGVEPVQAEPGESVLQGLGEGRLQGTVGGLTGRDLLHMDDLTRIGWGRCDLLEEASEVGRQPGLLSTENTRV
jgi:hypothetical protein